MDEIGRGTTPEDGIALAYACLHHLYHTNRCRSLFATHFHILADMSAHMKQLTCFCTDVAEDSDGSFSYVHRLREGVNKQSHALKVAQLAGESYVCYPLRLVTANLFDRTSAGSYHGRARCVASKLGPWADSCGREEIGERLTLHSHSHTTCRSTDQEIGQFPSLCLPRV